MSNNEKNESYFFFCGAVLPVHDEDILNRFQAYLQHSPIYIQSINQMNVKINNPGRITSIKGSPLQTNMLCWYVICSCTEENFKKVFGFEVPYDKGPEIKKILQEKIIEFFNLKDVPVKE